LRIVETVAADNDQRKRAMARRVAAALGGSLRGKTVALLGLTFKPNTDDMGDAPSISLITALQDMGAKVRAYDPVGIEPARRLFSEVTYGKNAYECAKWADALVVMTEWEQFRGLDLSVLKSVMSQPVLVDLRRVYRPEDAVRHGFAYYAVGLHTDPRDPAVTPANGDEPSLAMV
jgi:UDPglucose 6-dehydrogenase